MSNGNILLLTEFVINRQELDFDSEYIFLNPNGEPAKISLMDSYSETISKVLGRPFYFHSLRHQLCSRLFRIGLPADVIQEYFSWKSADMLNIYNDNEASDSFGKFFTKDGIKGSETKGLSDL